MDGCAGQCKAEQYDLVVTPLKFSGTSILNSVILRGNGKS